MSIKLNQSYYALIQVVNIESNLGEINRKLKVFADELNKFSANEPNILLTYRILNQIKIDIISKSKSMDLTVFDLLDRITGLLEIEIKVTLLKLENPTLIKLEMPLNTNNLELLNWTDGKNDLIALIYAISKSVNNGNAKIKKIVRCFEYIFQINLGNVYDVLQDLNIRKDGPCTYLNSLPVELLKKLESLNSK